MFGRLTRKDNVGLRYRKAEPHISEMGEYRVEEDEVQGLIFDCDGEQLLSDFFPVLTVLLNNSTLHHTVIPPFYPGTLVDTVSKIVTLTEIS